MNTNQSKYEKKKKRENESKILEGNLWANAMWIVVFG